MGIKTLHPAGIHSLAAWVTTSERALYPFILIRDHVPIPFESYTTLPFVIFAAMLNFMRETVTHATFPTDFLLLCFVLYIARMPP
jgi:hypothetical protein